MLGRDKRYLDVNTNYQGTRRSCEYCRFVFLCVQFFVVVVAFVVLASSWNHSLKLTLLLDTHTD